MQSKPTEAQKPHPRRRRRCAIASASSAAIAAAFTGALVMPALTPQSDAAVTGTWISPSLGNWEDAVNWQDGIIPGDTNPSANGDTALFNTPPDAGGTGTCTLTAPGRYLANITFDINQASSARSVTGTGTLYLTGGGSVQITANNITTSSPAVNTPIVLNGSSYTFINSTTTIASGLKFGGSISAGTNAPTTLFLDGVNANTPLQTSNSQISGTISDGAAAGFGGLSVVKNGTGVWDLRPTSSNTYSGDTVINAGAIRFNAAGAMSPNSNYIVNNGGVFRLSVAGTGKTLTLNAGGLLNGSPAGIAATFVSDSGPAVTLNMAAQNGTANTVTGSLAMGGTTAGQGGLRVLVSDVTGKLTMGSSSATVDLGSVNRPFEIAGSATNAGNGDPDLQINSAVNSGVSDVGIIKSGAGTLKLNNGANNFTGTLEVQQGSLRFNSDNALTGQPPLLLDGGDFNVQAFTQTVGAVTMTSGSVSATTTSPGTIKAPGFLFNVTTSNSATVAAGLADSGSSAAVTKTGTGHATLNGPLSYTGATTVSAGRLTINTNLLTSPSVNVTGGTLEMKASAGNDRVLLAPNLTVSGSGTLDLSNNKLITQNPVGSATAGTYNGVSGLIQSGRNGGGWTGNGIITSQSNATSGNFTSIGVATAQQVKSLANPTDTATFSGQTVTGSQTLVMYTYGGDANLDGKINVDDYGRIDFNVNLGTSGWYNGDFNYDGKVNVDDYGIIDFNVGIQGAPFPTAGGPTSVGLSPSGVSAVPEPASIAGVSLAASALLARRRRKTR